MVRVFAQITLAFALAVSFVAHGEMESSERFVVEFSKNRIYQGETVLCNFVLYSMEDRMESK